MITFISDKIDVKLKMAPNHKDLYAIIKDHYATIKKITTVNIDAPTIRAPKYTKQIPKELKVEITARYSKLGFVMLYSQQRLDCLDRESIRK